MSIAPPFGRCLALALLPSLGACSLRDGGHDRVATGPVQSEWLCSDGGGVCPRCSAPDGSACRDEHYAQGYRCSAAGDGRCEAKGGTCDQGLCLFRDEDHNGVDDALEREVAERNFPRLALHPQEQCALPRAVVYRVRRHPDDPRRLTIAYVVLYDQDCGELNGHLGDNEAFALTVDLDAQPGAPATVGVETVAHRNTICESVSTCSTEPGTGACGSNDNAQGAPQIVVYSSRDKHGNYLDVSTCAGNCFDDCALDAAPSALAMTDVGQPNAPLVRDLTSDGLLRASDGWNAALLHFDVWGSAAFGDAGHPSDQLTTLVAPAGLAAPNPSAAR